MTRQQLLGRFRGSALGVLWVLAQPLFLFVIYYAVFGVLFAPPDRKALVDAGFAVYLFSGLIAWGALSGTVARACTALTDNANLVKHATFPSEILPLPLLLSELVVYAAAAAILIAVGGAAGVVGLGSALLAWPLILAVHGAFTLGIALALATAQVFVRDTVHAYGVLSMAWLFASPIFWRLDVLASGRLGASASLLTLNPAYPLLQAHRAVLGLGEADLLWWHLGAAALWAVASMTVGCSIFARLDREIGDLV